MMDEGQVDEFDSLGIEEEPRVDGVAPDSPQGASYLHMLTNAT